MKFPAHLPRPLFVGIVIALAAGCSPQPPASNGPSPREVELSKTVEELRAKLAAAEQATAQAKAETARTLALLKKNEPTPAAQADTSENSPSTETKVADTSYIVVKKTLTPGQLIAKPTGAEPNRTERRPAEYHITFKGAQSGKEYPPLEVQELAYGRFREGVAYSPQDINAAKKPSLTAGGSGKATGGSGTLSTAEMNAIFGN